MLEWLRARPETRQVPVVILTSSADNLDVKRAYDLGANSYLMKPIDFDGLLDMVRNIGVYWFLMNELPAER